MRILVIALKLSIPPRAAMFLLTSSSPDWAAIGQRHATILPVSATALNTCDRRGNMAEVSLSHRGCGSKSTTRSETTRTHFVCCRRATERLGDGYSSLRFRGKSKRTGLDKPARNFGFMRRTRQVRALQRSTVLNLAEPNHIRKRDVDDPWSTQFCLRKKMIRLIGKRGKKKYAN